MTNQPVWLVHEDDADDVMRQLAEAGPGTIIAYRREKPILLNPPFQWRYIFRGGGE